jgi:diguanylate cyclase (GGDEF)-like protein
MKDSDAADSRAYALLTRLSVYIIVLALIILGVQLFFLIAPDTFLAQISNHIASAGPFGGTFPALLLLAPFALIGIGYLINERGQLLKKVVSAETQLRQRNIELSTVNDLLTKENLDRRRTEEKLLHHALHDSLTDLPNRSLFMDRLHSALERKKRHPEYLFAVFFLDIDRFKFINDSLGHLVGDQLLIMLGKRLGANIRSLDTLARFGGDEFAVLMEDVTDVSHVMQFAERVHSELALPFQVRGHELFVTVSIGIVLSNAAAYSRPEELIRDADTAMYNAKARGKACHVLFDSAMHAEASAVFLMETDLRRALEREEFVLHYQPIVSLETEEIIGFEALLRWQHPERGLIPAAEFIAMAEETKLMPSIGRWVMREACGQFGRWQMQLPGCRDLTIGINVSSDFFSAPDFYEFVEGVLRESALQPGSLRIEIVERLLIENPESVSALLTRLKDLDIRFDIDDFGTGYSALNYLRHFPINGLKIDRSFVKELPSDRNNTEIVKTIIALAHVLDLDVIAEGIETAEQMEMLRTMKGQYAQGFYVFKPMDGKAAEHLLSSRRHQDH